MAKSMNNTDSTKFDNSQATSACAGVENVVLTSTDYTVVSKPARGAICTGTAGDISVVLQDGSTMTLTVDPSSANGGIFVLAPFAIIKVLKATTTVTVPYVIL